MMGWASGMFGLFGLKPQIVSNSVYNYTGMALALIGFVIFLQVQSKPKVDDTSTTEPLLQGKNKMSHFDEANIRLLTSDDGVTNWDPLLLQQSKIVDEDQSFGSSFTKTQKRVVGLAMAIFTGVLFGCSFDPSQYIIDNEYDGHDDSLNYVFPHFCGIVIASWVYFAIYLIYHKRIDGVPFIDKRCILPGIIAGVLWGIAEISWFIANGILGFSISFPIITIGPGFIGSMWGILVFKEITGTRNLLILALAFAVTLPGLILVALSR